MTVQLAKNKKVLNLRYEAFCREIVRTNNGPLAYKRAGFSKASKATCEVQSSRLLRNPQIIARIQELQEQLTQKALNGLHQEWMRTLKRRQDIAYADIAEMVDPVTNEIKPIHEMPKRVRAAVASIKKVKGGVELKIKDDHPHLSAIEDKYAFMPDNQKTPQRVEITIGTMSDCDKALKELLISLRQKKEQVSPVQVPIQVQGQVPAMTEVNMLPAHIQPQPNDKDGERE